MLSDTAARAERREKNQARAGFPLLANLCCPWSMTNTREGRQALT